MDTLDKLLGRLKEAKEALSKNINESYSSSPNLAMSEDEEKKKEKEEAEKAERGVNPVSNPAEPGRSPMGLMNRIGAPDQAKAIAKEKVKEMKRMPKPKLVKSINEQETIGYSDNGQWSINSEE